MSKCASDTCQNGGSCKDEESGYRCTCVAGFVGTTCETSMSSFYCLWICIILPHLGFVHIYGFIVH